MVRWLRWLVLWMDTTPESNDAWMFKNKVLLICLLAWLNDWSLEWLITVWLITWSIAWLVRGLIGKLDNPLIDKFIIIPTNDYWSINHNHEVTSRNSRCIENQRFRKWVNEGGFLSNQEEGPQASILYSHVYKPCVTPVPLPVGDRHLD